MAENTTTIIVKNSDGYETKIIAGNHSLYSDESISAGGTDTGPNPYELLLGALGSCKAMTMRMYASRKNIPLQAITIKLNQKKIHAEDCENCETKEEGIDKIDVEISFIGNLSVEEKKRLLEISEKCPVHKTLTSEIKINISLSN